MAKANYKLASQQATTGKYSNGRITAKTTNAGSSAVSGMRAPIISPAAANARYSPVRPPDILETNLLSEGAKFADVAIQSAFKFQQRENLVIANQGLVELENELMTSYYGGANPDGTRKDGYGDTQLESTRLGYEPYNQGLTAMVDKKLEGYSPAVKNIMTTRAASLAQSYKAKAAKHRHGQLEAEAENSKVLGIETALTVSSHNSDYLFEQDATTGNTNMLEFVGAHAGSEEEARVLQDNLLKGVFKGIRYKEGQNPASSYANANSWVKRHEHNLPQATRNEFAQQLSVMKTAADAELDKNRADMVAQQKSAIENEGGTFIAGIMKSGEAGDVSIDAYYSAMSEMYKDDPHEMATKMTKHLLTGFEDAAMDKTVGYESAVAKLEEFMANGKEKGYAFAKDSVFTNEIEKFVTKTIPEKINNRDNSQNERNDNIAKLAISKTAESFRGQIDEGELILADRADVLKKVPGWEVGAEDTQAVVDEKKLSIDNAIKYSQARQSRQPPADTSAIASTIEAFRAKGGMFKSEAIFERYLIDNGVLNSTDRKALMDVRKDLESSQGTAVNNYKQGLFELAKSTMRPSSLEKIINSQRESGGEGGLAQATEGVIDINNVGIFEDTKGATPTELNFRAEIDSMSRDKNLSPRERVKGMRDIVTNYVNNVEGASNLEEAFQLQAAGIRVEYYLNQHGEAIRPQSNGEPTVRPPAQTTSMMKQLGDAVKSGKVNSDPTFLEILEGAQ